MYVAINIRYERKRKQMTQVELARRAGVHRNTILRIEHGRLNPSLKLLEKIALALDVPVEKLVKEVV